MLRTAAHTLPGAVGLLQQRGGYQKGGAQSAVIKNCLQYISTHLHEKLHGAYESQEGGGHDGQ